MKRFLFLLMILKLSSLARAQTIIEKWPQVIITVDDTVMSKYMRYSSKDTFKFSIKRKDKSRDIILLFPAWSTGNSVSLYKNQDYDKYDYREIHKYAIRKDDAFMEGFDAQLTLDLTSLEDGDYIAVYSSCNHGGKVKISIITE